MFCGLGEEERTRFRQKQKKRKKEKKTHRGHKWVGRDKRISKADRVKYFLRT